jgi:branched-chain amino acid transport system ATP-binding protein
MGALLEVKGLTKYFKGLRAVYDVSFAVEEKEIFGLIGPNGSGKTTMFNMISGLYIPSGGSIFFQGVNITGLQPNRICHLGIGRTFQITKPFLKLTVLENVMIGALNCTRSVSEAEKNAREILAQMGLENKAQTQGKTLSVPERKRLELARALATEPQLLLLDEVMAGLTPSELNEMIAVLRKIHQRGVTIFIVEHIMHAIMAISQRIMVLHHGEMIALGPPAEIVRNEGVVEAYLGEEYNLA